MAITGKKKRRAFGLTFILALSFCLLCISALFISGAVQGLSFLITLQENVQTRMGSVSREAKDAVSGFIRDKERLLLTAVDLTNLGSAPYARQQEIVDNLLALEPYFRNIALLNPGGGVIASGSHVSRSDTIRFLKLLSRETRDAFRRRDIYTGDVYIESLTGEPMMIIAVPARDALKDVKAYLVTEVGLRFMWDLVGSIKTDASGAGYVYVVDRRGILIAFRDVGRVIKGEKTDAVKAVGEFIRAPAGKEAEGVWTYRGLDGVDVVGTYLPLGSPDWAVVTELPVVEADRPRNRALGTTVIAIALLTSAALLVGIILARRLAAPLVQLTAAAEAIAAGDNELEVRVNGSREALTLGAAFNSMTSQLRSKAESFREANRNLTAIIGTSRDIVSNLNATAREIEAAAQEQTTASNEHASGITEVSATLQELTITARQITHNVGELVLASEEAMRMLTSGMERLTATIGLLEDAGAISRDNAAQIGELGKRSVLINEMVELIREVANKTNILSINASIEASRAGEAGSGFSVVAAEIRELSKETIESAKKADKAAKDIQGFLDSIIGSSRKEATKVQEGGDTVKEISSVMGEVVSKINNNYSFTQKIDVSIKQQEAGSAQAAETMRQMAEISRQSAETARQTLAAVKNIVTLAESLEEAIGGSRLSEAPASQKKTAAPGA